MSEEFNAEKALSVKDGTGSKLFGCFGYLFGFVFSSMFFGIGSLFLWVSIIGPLIKIQSAKSWIETPCVIVESQIDQGGNHRLSISYKYDFGGRTFESDQAVLSNMNSGERAAKERLIARYPKDSLQTCYVNPEFPSEAVLDRDSNGVMWAGLIAIPFVLVGLTGYFVLFNMKRWKARVQDHLTSVVNEQRSLTSSSATSTTASAIAISDSDYDDDDLVETPGPITLTPESHRWGAFIFLAIFALFWNGIVGAIFFGEVMDVFKGGWQWSILFFVPFILVGIGVLIGAVYCFLALFNPLPIVTLSRQLIPLAGSASAQWKFNGPTRSIRNLKIILKGIEEATYRRGTDTTTDTNTFYEETLYESLEQIDIAEGKIEFTIPTDTMHSFTGSNNKIKWTICFQGDIPLWPDVSEAFPIRVVPHE